MLILKQNTAASVPTPASGKGTIFLNDSDVLSVKNSSGVTTSFPTVGGANTQVLFNDDSALSGDANFTFDKDTDILTVTGNIAATRVLSDNLLYANGVAWDLGGDPAGSNTQVQYNNDGEFGAEAAFTYDQATNTLTVDNVAGLLTTPSQTGITSTGTLTSLTVTGNIGAGNISAGTGELAGATLITTGNATVGGNLTVNGNLTYVNVDSFAVEFIFGSEVTITDEVVAVGTFGNVRANVFYGDGSGLANIVGANIIGIAPNATHAVTANTVVDSSQPNITSLGTLTSILVGTSQSADYANAKIVSGTDSGVQAFDNIGVVGEATGDSGDGDVTGIGVKGYGKTASGTKGTGVFGEALVSATGDTGAAVGVRGFAKETLPLTTMLYTYKKETLDHLKLPLHGS